MKKLLLQITAIAVFACTAQASLILSNSFGYPDGPLVTVSSGSALGVWTTHSGTAAQVDVTSGAISLTTTDSEDVSTVLTNAFFPTAISNGTIYASFDVNFSVLPTAAVYFGHFRGTGTDFRCRIFMAPSSPAGQVKIGIVNFSSGPAYAPINLDQNTTYRIVVRFVDSGAATLWINPTSESNTANKVDAVDTVANTFAGAYYWSWRNGETGRGTLSLDNLLIGTTFQDVVPPSPLPSISPIPDQVIAADTSTGPLPFAVEDTQTPAEQLVVSAFSENTTLIPVANVTFGGAGANRTATITPAGGQQGTTKIGLVVTDGNSLTATSMVSVIVGRPTISTIPNQITKAGTPFPVVNFAVNDTETPNSLSVTASSANQGLILDGGLQITGTGTNRTLQITPVVGETGASTITIVVSDGIQTATNILTAAVSPQLGLLVSDDFSYPDGMLPESSAYAWLGYSSSTSNDMAVASEKVVIARTNYMDSHIFYTGSPTFGASSGAILYSKLILNQKETPSSGGTYFAFFKESGTTQFRARIFTKTSGAAPGKFRLAISSGGFSEQAFPQDLNLDTDYTVITKYDTVNNLATMWVNPSSEQSQSVSGVDSTTGTDLMAYGLRQDGYLGVLTVDNLRVGTSWEDVYSASTPFSIPLNIQNNGNGTVTLTWSNPVFKLQEKASLSTGTWTTLTSATSGYSVSATGTKFYRLIAE